MNSTCSSLIRPSLKVSERAVLIPSTADTGELDERAQALVDEPPVASQRRQEAAQHVVQRDVVIAGHAEHLMAALAQPLEELARFPELLGPGALGEVAADDDQVGLQLVDLPFDRLDQPRVMRAEMKVGEMDEAGHVRERAERVGLRARSFRSSGRSAA